MAQTQMSGGLGLVLALVGLGLGLGGGYLLFGAKAEPEAGQSVDTVDEGRDTGEGTGATLEAGATQVRALEKALADERETNAQLRKQRDELVAAMAQRGEAGEGGEVGEGETKAKKAARFQFENTGAALDTLDYDEAAESFVKLPGLIKELVDGFRRGEQVPEVAGEIQRWNGPLVQAALKIHNEGKLGGTGINGAFTHPAAQVNFIHATLKEAGSPLSEDQETDLQKIGDRYVEEEAARQANVRDDAFQLETLIQECALKDRFYADVDRMLSQAQRDILHPEGVRGRVQLDLFSSGIVWAQVAGALPFSNADRTEIAKLVEARIATQLGGDATAIQVLRSLVPAFVNALDDEALQTPLTPGMAPIMGVPVAHVVTCAKAMLVMQKGLSDALPADHRLQAEIRGSGGVIVPLYRAP